MSLCFITGTDTDAGKTVATCQLLRACAATGARAAAMKPAASGCEWRDGTLWNSDVAAHAAASNVKLPPEWVNPYRFEPPISPHLAARAAHVEIDLAHIQHCAVALMQQTDVLLVEGAGGWLAPLNEQQCMADLAVALAAPVVLVVGMRLGCLNHAALTAESILRRGLPLVGWIANQVDPDMACQEANLDWLCTHLPAPHLATIGYQPQAELAALPLEVGQRLQSSLSVISAPKSTNLA